MVLTSFCGLLTLQVGAAILAAVFFTLAAVILVANVFSYHNSIVDGWFPFSLVLMIIFVIGLIVAGVLMFASSYSENRSLAKFSVIVIAVLLCYWLILCCFSLLSNPDHVNGVCIDWRCPESFWIANLGFRRQHVPEVVNRTYQPAIRRLIKRHVNLTYGNATTIGVEGFRRKSEDAFSQTGNHIDSINLLGDQENTVQDQQTMELEKYTNDNRGNFEAKDGYYLDVNILNRSSVLKHKAYAKQIVGPLNVTRFYFIRRGPTTPAPMVELYEEPSRYIFGLPLIAAILLFLINLIFLIFSAYAMYSWAQELGWTDYFYDDDDEPVVIVDDY